MWAFILKKNTPNRKQCITLFPHLSSCVSQLQTKEEKKQTNANWVNLFIYFKKHLGKLKMTERSNVTDGRSWTEVLLLNCRSGSCSTKTVGGSRGTVSFIVLSGVEGRRPLFGVCDYLHLKKALGHTGKDRNDVYKLTPERRDDDLVGELTNCRLAKEVWRWLNVAAHDVI